MSNLLNKMVLIYLRKTFHGNDKLNHLSLFVLELLTSHFKRLFRFRRVGSNLKRKDSHASSRYILIVEQF